MRSLEQFSSVDLGEQGATISVAYSSADGQPLHDIDVSIDVRGIFDEPLFHLSPRLVRADFSGLPAVGVIECTLPNVPLQAGSYHLAISARTGRESCDYVQHAGILEVESGDYFGTGVLPPTDDGPFLVEQRWSVESGTAG